MQQQQQQQQLHRRTIRNSMVSGTHGALRGCGTGGSTGNNHAHLYNHWLSGSEREDEAKHTVTSEFSARFAARGITYVQARARGGIHRT